MHVLGEPCVENSRQHPFLDSLEVLVGGNDGRELFVVPMIEDLIELFPRPRRGVFCTQIVQNEKLGVANGVESIIIGYAVTRVEGGTQMIEQIWNNRKKDTQLLVHHGVVGD